MITVLLKAHSKRQIYQTIQLDIAQEDLDLPVIGSGWDIEFASGYFTCEVSKIELRDSSIVIYSSDTNPVQYFDHKGNRVRDIWMTQPDGEKLLILPN